MSDQHDGSTLAREWREAREALLELAAKLPETRAYRNTDRAGWTLKHELSHIAGLDDELRHLVQSARAGWSDHQLAGLRRRRGQAMHAAQEMRLGRLREHLAAAGEATAQALEEAGDALGASVRIAESEAASVAQLARERLERARQSVALFQHHLGG
ncbi:MAG: maleylpyruvate isomerase N-terminal domain-containing protein [Dehalococcoidia bacterium]